MSPTHRPLSLNELEQIKHPNETSRFILALLVCLPFTVGLIVLVVYSYGIILVYFGIIVFLIWFGLSIAKARLLANAVRVSSHNFPEIHQVVESVKYMVGYHKRVDVYIVEDGSINAFLAKFFGTKFIIINSELARDMLQGQKLKQLQWVIARFIGFLRIKQIRLNLLSGFLENIENLAILNIFIYPYIRATQYSGDNIGLAVCMDVEQAMITFDKFLVGNDLSGKVNIEGILEQGKHIRGNFFVFVARLFSPFPHTISRYMNLLAFAKWRYPEQFQNYIRRFHISTSADIAHLLPGSYLRREMQGFDRGGGYRYAQNTAPSGFSNPPSPGSSGERKKVRVIKK